MDSLLQARSIFARGLRVLLPLVLLIIPLPFDPTYASLPYRASIVAGVYFMLGCSRFAVHVVERWVPVSRLPSVLGLLLPILSLLLSGWLWSLGKAGAISPSLALAGMMGSVVLFRLFQRHEAQIAAVGPLSLLAFLNVFLAGELVMRSVPPEHLAVEVKRAIQPDKPFDRTLNVYNRNGFRGRLIKENAPRKGLRIFTTGGSSTYGMPMEFASSAYAGVLERIIAERHPLEAHEVYNAGVPGFGITQIVDVLERRLLAYHPDVVTVCAWFNDAASGSGWYGFPGHSETEALALLRRAERLKALPIVSTVVSTQSFAWYQFYLTRFAALFTASKGAASSSVPNRPRMTPEEFGDALRHLVSLGEKHNFLPVFVFEPEHRTRPHDEAIAANPYYQVMLKVAKEGDVPVVDTLVPFGERRHEWLFYDVIHSNEEAHRTIAEEIYRSIFEGRGNTEKGRRFLSSKGIGSQGAAAGPEVVLQLRRKDIEVSPGVSVSIRAPHLSDEDGDILGVGVYSGLDRIAGLDHVTGSPKDFRLRPDEVKDLTPLVDLSFRVELSKDVLKKSFSVRPEGPWSPAYIHAVSESATPFRRGLIQINGRKFVPTEPGYGIALLTARTGRVVAVRYLPYSRPRKWKAELEELNQLIADSFEDGQPPLMVLTVGNTGNAPRRAPKLQEFVRRCGGSGRLPVAHESMVVLGSCDGRESQGREIFQNGTSEIEVGDLELISKALIEVKVEGAPQPVKMFFR